MIGDEAALCTHNYVVLEICALAQRRLGMEALRVLAADVLPLVDIGFVDEALHKTALLDLLGTARSRVSLVDCASFAFMRARGLTTAFAFDSHYAERRFKTLS